MEAQSSSSRSQFALTPTPLSYAVPPGTNLSEGLLRSLAGFWPERPAPVSSDGKVADGNGLQESLKRKASSSVGKEPVSLRKASCKLEEINPPDDIPEGFRIVVQIRKTGKTAGHKDKYYIDENGRKFRSKLEINRYREAMQQNVATKTSDAAPVAASSSPVEQKNPTETSKAPGRAC